MVKRKVYKQKTIVAIDAVEFDRLMNTVFENLSSYSDVDVHYYNDRFAATIRYSMDSIVEEYHSEPTHMCRECIYYIPPLDKRRKYVRCTYPAKDQLIRSNSIICENFYEREECV